MPLRSFVLASSGGGLLSMLVAGCYLSHSTGALDGGTERDGGDRRDATVVMPRDAASDAAARCSRPVSDWARSNVELDGRWSRVHLARDGESRWLIAQPIDGGALHALELDPSSASPRPRGDVVLQGTEGAQLVAADGDRFRIATITRPATLQVHDPSGARLSVADIPLGADGSPTIALRGARVGLVVQGPAGTLAEVRDVEGGPPISSTMLEGWTHSGVGEGLGLFAFLASERGESSTYAFRLDARGAIRAERLDVWFRFDASDGETFVGMGVASIGLRHPDGRLQALDLPPEPLPIHFFGPTVAVGPVATVVAVITENTLWLVIDGEWVELGDHDLPLAMYYADQSDRRVGGFFVEHEVLRWAGLTCDG